MLQDADGNISGPRTVIAGFGAGVTESLLAVTPFESIKTTLYVDSLTTWSPVLLTMPLELMIAKAPTLECEDSSMPFP